jgi:NAD(P)-dependent dehydrogenase (short-subunit alcohol dehydrogenase family)
VKRVLVTGSSTGFGRILCTAFLERGWSVIATMRGAAGRKALFKADAERFGDKLTILDLEVTDAGEREAAAKAVEKSGGLDCLVNNAGYGVFGPLEELSEEQWRRQMEVNFFGAVFLTRRLLPSLRAAKGKVINMSSVLGLTAFPLSTAYCASKYALEGMSEALYYELRPHGAQVAIVEPGGVRTEFAANMTHAELSTGSAYRGQVDAYRAMLDKKMKSGPGVSPAAVVKATVRLAESRRMPLRTVVGVDAKMLDAVARWLPRNWGSSLMAGVYGKLLMPKNGR